MPPSSPIPRRRIEPGSTRMRRATYPRPKPESQTPKFIFDNLCSPWKGSGMPSDQTRNVSLTPELNAFIRAQVASGQYQNASEVVRAGLRLLVQQIRRDGDAPSARRERGRDGRAG